MAGCDKERLDAARVKSFVFYGLFIGLTTVAVEGPDLREIY
jgi:hypothetical protein